MRARLQRHSPPIGSWRSAEARDVYDRAYARAFDRLPSPTRTLDVRTGFGWVRAYEFRGSTAAADAPPVVLLPGRSSGTPMWSSNLSELAGHRTAYAVDALGDAGRSVQTRAIVSPADQAAWIDEALDGLGLGRVHLLGHSFGGWSAANYARHHPDRLATLSLLEPVFVFTGLRWQMYLVSLPASIRWLPAGWRKAMTRRIGGGGEIDPADPVAAMIDSGLAGYASRLPIPRRPTTDQLAHLDVPTFVALGGASAMHDSAAAAATARAVLPRPTVHIWPSASHSLPMEVADELNGELVQFMSRYDG